MNLWKTTAAPLRGGRERRMPTATLCLFATPTKKATGNTWNDSDSAAYKENNLARVPVERIVFVVDAVTRRNEPASAYRGAGNRNMI